jgi:hypothetical protein
MPIEKCAQGKVGRIANARRNAMGSLRTFTPAGNARQGKTKMDERITR